MPSASKPWEMRSTLLPKISNMDQRSSQPDTRSEGTGGLHPFVLAFCHEHHLELAQPELLQIALTHPTFAFEHPGTKDYERMEFLGDAVLELIISEVLFDRARESQEGRLSKIRSALVCEPTLAKLADQLKLGEHMLLGHGEERTGGRQKASNLADCFEATLAALYLNWGLEKASAFIIDLYGPIIDDALNGRLFHDYKSKLLEAAQANHLGDRVCFKIIKERGPVHQPTFEAAVMLDDQILATATGGSKKTAEQAAAEIVLKMDPNPLVKDPV